MSKLSKVWYQKNSPCCSVLLWTSFCILQVSQQKLVGMVSTSNIAYSEQIYKPFQWKPSHIMFLIKKRRSADAQYWTITLSNWKKQPPEVFYKNTVLKNFAIFMGKHLCEIFQNTCFEEHLCTAVSELTFWSDCLEFCFWIAYQTLSNQSFKQNLAYMPSICLNPCAFLWT